MLKTHDGPYDVKTMKAKIQLKFQCDADLGGNPDNGHLQTSYVGFLARSLFCWCSTESGSVSTSTADSEIKAIHHFTTSCSLFTNPCVIFTVLFLEFPLQLSNHLSTVQLTHYQSKTQKFSLHKCCLYAPSATPVKFQNYSVILFCKSDE